MEEALRSLALDFVQSRIVKIAELQDNLGPAAAKKLASVDVWVLVKQMGVKKPGNLGYHKPLTSTRCKKIAPR
jgi:hypothetical protein